MRGLIRSLLAVLLVVLMAALTQAQTPPPGQAAPGAPQAPPRDPNAPKTATGVIKGRVTAADTGAPLRRARLVLSSGAQARPATATTDAQGRYEFTELAAGRYTLIATKNSYVTLQYGQRRAFEGGKGIELADGATLDRIDFTLPRGGVIAGTIVDDLGEPMAGVRVAAMRSRYRQGKRTLTAVGRYSETNDLGQYRLYGLEPGTYFVGTLPVAGPLAGGAAQAGTVELASLEQGFAYSPCYYPGTLNPAEAQRVSVRVGQERAATDFTQLPGRMATISGMILGAPAGPPGSTSVVLMSTTTLGSMTIPSVKSDGSFSIPNVAPGDYALAISTQDPASGERQMAGLQLTVTGDDMNVQVPMSAGARISGRVVMDDAAPPPFPSSGVRVSPSMLPSGVPIRAASAMNMGAISEDWTFDLKGIGGSILFRLSALPAGYMLKSVLLDGRDITDTPLEVRGTEDIAGLQIVVTSHVTSIEGTPTDAKGKPVSDYAVVVFAEDQAQWKYPSRFLSTARPDQQGRFKVTNLPPGRYLGVAVGYLEEGQSDDPDYLEALRPLAIRFTLGDGETKTLELKVINPQT